GDRRSRRAASRTTRCVRTCARIYPIRAKRSLGGRTEMEAPSPYRLRSSHFHGLVRVPPGGSVAVHRGTGTGSSSEHAYGEAVDVNPVEKPYVGCGMTRCSRGPELAVSFPAAACRARR